jgi:hypothetical protein
MDNGLICQREEMRTVSEKGRNLGLCAKPHNCGVFIFILDFTRVGGFADRYLLYFVYVSCVYRNKCPTSVRVFYVVGC